MWMSLFSKEFGSIPNELARLLTRESAACALSRITSPNWPVRISLPLPGIFAASTNRMSPPTGVHARPVATPGMPLRIATSASNLRAPRIACRSAASTCAFGNSNGHAAEYVADLALQVAHTRLARVVVDDRQQRFVGDLALRSVETG